MGGRAAIPGFTLRAPRADDAPAFTAAVRASRALHAGLVHPPDTAAAYRAWLARTRRDDMRSFLAVLPEGAPAGVVNASEIVRGNFRSAYLGYYAFAGHERRGLMTEAVRRAVRALFREEGLHRVEANIQPGNDRSRALVERLGFRLEGFSPRYLKIGGRWRDHERWALLADEPARRPTARRAAGPALLLAAALACSGVARAAEGAVAEALPGRAATPRAGDDATPPDILLVVADDMSRDDLAVIDTPAIDRLAARGVSFGRAYSDPVCSPSRVCLLLGVYAYREGIGTVVRGKDAVKYPDEVNPPLGTDGLTLPELLHASGYATLAAGKNHLGNDVHGVSTEALRVLGFDHHLAGTVYTLEGGGYSDWRRVDDGRVSAETVYNTTAITDAVLDWWHATDGPRFAYVAYNAPHKPLHAPPAELLPPGLEVGQHPRARYEAMVMALDHEFGRLLDGVDLANTLVVFTADNGTPAAAAPPGVDRRLLKGSFEDGGVCVPLVVAGPGVAAGASGALVNLSDVYRTLADRAGARVPATAALDSVSFLPQLTDPSVPGARAWVYSEMFEPNGPGPKWGIKLMARTLTHKLVWMDNDGAGPVRPREYLIRTEPDRFVREEERTEEDLAALALLSSVLAERGPPRGEVPPATDDADDAR